MIAAMVAVAWPTYADAATRYVADTGIDGPACGVDAAAACRSITQAIALASPGDTVLVGPGRYGDLNSNGILGDIPGEETESPGCGCAVSVNKPVIVMSSGGAEVTLIDSRKAYLIQNVLLITVGGEFGRPGKGFTVTETTHFGYKANDGHGIVIDSSNTMVRGNRVIDTRVEFGNESIGIYPVNDEPVRIEGNQALHWFIGIVARGAARVSKNEVIYNSYGMRASAGELIGNVATGNRSGFLLSGTVTVSGNAAYMNSTGFHVSPPFTGSFTRNNMFGNGTPESNCGVANGGISGLVATNNYWGTADGPGAPPADTACVDSGYTGSTITWPYATKPFAVKILKP
jgi:hypothetical protein